MNNIYLFAVLNAILLFAQITNAIDPKLRGQLLTPNEGCGISKVLNTKIVGGTGAKRGAFPWIALIGYGSRLTQRFLCGGTLITSRHVLTAAHCIRPSLSHVRLGEHDLSKSDGKFQDIDVIQVMEHPRFNDEFKFANDIAILELEDDVDFTDRIRPVCLPLSNSLKDKSFVGENPFVAGWGRVRENGGKSDILMQVQFPVVHDAQCVPFAYRIYKFWGKIPSAKIFTNSVICAGNMAGGHDACKGDSGGPLMLPIFENGTFATYQLGVVSAGIGCGRKNSVGLYTRVTNYLDWIKSEINHKR